MLQDHLIAVGILKGYILKLHIPVQGLPVFPFRVKMISVFLYDLRGVLYIRLLRQKAGEALDIYLDRDQGRERIDDPLHRFQHTDRIGHKHRQCSDPDDALHCQCTAAPEDQRQGHGG